MLEHKLFIMKKIKVILSSAFLSLMFISATATNGIPKTQYVKIPDNASQENIDRATELDKKMQEFNTRLESNTVSKTEKKVIKSELRDIKDEIKSMDGFGIYIGGGTLLLIILLIILL